MDIKPSLNSVTKNIEKNAEKISSMIKNNNGNPSPKKNFMLVEVKEETIGDEIQEYAASTMSELLGWYGYDKIDSDYTKNLNLDHFTFGSNTKDNQMLQFDQNIIPNASPNEQLSPSIELKPISKFRDENDTSSVCSDNITCSWCSRIAGSCAFKKRNSISYSTRDTVGHFCNEDSFIAGRTACKETKTYDWSMHVSNPIDCVDFQDDESQLKFCSDKCLNQYKINIFCHETQTHLMLKGLSNVSFHDTEKGSLITPELWFQNCQSPPSNCMEDTFVTDGSLLYNTSSSHLDNKTNQMEQNDNEKSEFNSKVLGKDSVFTIKCKTINDYNKKKNNLYNKSNEDDVKKYIREQALVTEENNCYHFMSNQNYSSVNYSQKSDLDCKRFKNCSLIDIINSYHHQQHDNIILEKSIHVKSIQRLQEEKHDYLMKKILRSSSWFSRSATSLTQSGVPLLSQTCTHTIRQTKTQNQTTSKMSTSIQLSPPTNCSPTTLLPSLNVPISHPIPIPILIPIPLPVSISAPICDNFTTNMEKNFTSIDNPKCEDVKYQHLLENLIGNNSVMADILQLSRNETITETNNCPRSLESMFSFDINDESNVSLHQLIHNAKHLKNRKHTFKMVNDSYKELKKKKRKIYNKSKDNL